MLLRHGETEWNAEGRWQGQLNSPLSDLGRRQAFDAGRLVGSVDVIVSSDLGRAQETAQIIADSVGIGPIQTDPGLRERAAGEWEGMTRTAIRAQYDGWLDGERRPVGWESDEVLAARALESFRRWAAVGEMVLVVTHGGLIRAVEMSLGAPYRRIPNLGGRLLHGESTFVLGDEVTLAESTYSTGSQAPG